MDVTRQVLEFSWCSRLLMTYLGSERRNSPGILKIVYVSRYGVAFQEQGKDMEVATVRVLYGIPWERKDTFSRFP